MTGEDTNGDFIRITNREVWSRLGEVEALNRHAIADNERNSRAIAELRADFAEYAKSTDRRIRGLELRFYGILAGLIGVLGAIVAVPRVG